MTLRLHPDDLLEISKNISKEVSLAISTIYCKEHQIKELQTFSVEETARVLNVHETTVLRYLCLKSLKGTKRGKNWIISRQSLIDFIDDK
jgi:excisionase family DNA binding protein